MSQLRQWMPQALLGFQNNESLPELKNIPIDLFDGIEDSTLAVEQIFLQQAGVVSVCENAGWLPDKPVNAEQQTEPAPLPVRVHASDEFIRRLLKTLPAGSVSLKLEVLKAFKPVRDAIPSMLWPELFESCLVSDCGDIYQAGLSELMTPQAVWLARKNPRWRGIAQISSAGCNDNDSVMEVDIDVLAAKEAWQFGTRQIRLQYFKRLRHLSPQKAVALLERDYQEIRAAEKADFIEALSDRLSEADIPFLEAQLRQRSENVRLAGRQLLRKLPDSPYVQNLQNFLGQRLMPVNTGKGFLGMFRKKPRLSVDWPDEIDSFEMDWAALAISTDAKQAQAQGLSVTEHLLQQVVAAIPLCFWEKYAGISPEELLEVASDSLWAAGILRGWFEQIELTNNAQWAKAVIDAPAKSGKKMIQHEGNVRRLFACLSVETHIERLWPCSLPENTSGDDFFNRITELCNHIAPDFYFSADESEQLAKGIVNEAGRFKQDQRLSYKAYEWHKISFHFAPEWVAELDKDRTEWQPPHFDDSVQLYIECLDWRRSLYAGVNKLKQKLAQSQL